MVVNAAQLASYSQAKQLLLSTGKFETVFSTSSGFFFFFGIRDDAIVNFWQHI